MKDRLVLPTERSSVQLRQLILEDAPYYFAAVDANRKHLSQFDDKTANNYPDLKSVVSSITNPKDPTKLRLGIWDNDTFVGTINLKSTGEGGEIGYWVDGRHSRHGYATIATKAMAAYASGIFTKVYAEVIEGNDPSARVLERAGFIHTANEASHLIFELSDTIL